MAMFDVLGFYREKGWIPQDDAMNLWRGSLRVINPYARAYIALRTEEENLPKVGEERLWPFFQRLLDEAGVRPRNATTVREGDQLPLEE